MTSAELTEDAYWVRLVHERMKSFKRTEALTHEQVWGRLPKLRKRASRKSR